MYFLSFLACLSPTKIVKILNQIHRASSKRESNREHNKTISGFHEIYLMLMFIMSQRTQKAHMTFCFRDVNVQFFTYIQEIVQTNPHNIVKLIHKFFFLVLHQALKMKSSNWAVLGPNYLFTSRTRSLVR